MKAGLGDQVKISSLEVLLKIVSVRAATLESKSKRRSVAGSAVSIILRQKCLGMT